MTQHDCPIRAVCDRLGGRKAVAEALGIGLNALANWRARGGIPPRHWPALVDLARARGIEGVTWDTLRRLSAPGTEPPAGDGFASTAPPASGGEGVRAPPPPPRPRHDRVRGMSRRPSRDPMVRELLEWLATIPLDELARRLRRPEADARSVRDSARALLTRWPKETTR